MVQPEEVRSLLRKQPFEPFRVHLQDGSVYDIKYPRLNLASDLTFVIGLSDPKNPDPVIAKKFVRVGWSFITRVERLTSAASA